ncbi:MAG: aminomethyl-transferring glycine dehydrogenase [Bifidobacteriaceae bacterium]|jgi:glycine dehydrogenase|nr:aminomethyl-transferring glycine dehydrogenase [Bifidobacteriaceae bacterium]
MDGGRFAARHMGLPPGDRARVRRKLGLGPDEGIVHRALPKNLHRASPPALPPPATQSEVLDRLRALAALNRPTVAMIGLGYYASHTPAVLRRGVLENPAWYTAYTPYQPEISQGRLEALLVFQTALSDLTALPTVNASLLDEATAVAEAMTLMARVDRGRRPRVAVDVDLFPATRAVLATRAEPLGIDLIDFDPAEGEIPGEVAGAIVQYQGASGRLVELAPVAAAAHGAGALLAVAADPLALTLLRPPGEAGADVVVGSTGRFGMPIGFGGPHAAYMAVRRGLERQLPGRLVGVSKDADGAPALRLALQTREQHIRREKATSNICTAQVLPAVMAAMFAVWHGAEGLAAIAAHAHGCAVGLAQGLREAGHEVIHSHFFDTVAVRVPGRAHEVKAAARERGIGVWAPDGDTVWVSTDETTTRAHVAGVAAAFGVAHARLAYPPTDRGGAGPASCIPAGLARTSPYLTHPVFAAHRTETGMMRYLRRLAGRDYALDRGMIPLGSCTMKLNAAVEMAALTWPEFGSPHPFGDFEDAAGTMALVGDLETWLAAITGYDAVSVQPNAGSQGELAGLLAIRRYHASRGEAGRTVCLIPTSAHGTNAASAALAGLTVVGVATLADGSVDQGDLAAKLSAYGDTVAAIMLTYPSTFGVYEEGIGDVCEAVHAAGGQVYIDGANFNALVGYAAAGEFGGDISHINLHKTFAMPHGGGGPGVGPVAARAHLAPFLPGHPLGPASRPGHPVAGAPFGSPLLFPISWAYIALMGAAGLAEATEGAVLAANYVAARLDGEYPVAYRGPGGFVAHECVIDLHGLTARTGVTADDVAKRLIDYGFHAPTMSFPVAGTLMVEPTESESLAELDRFCDAMVAIAAEARDLADDGAGEGIREDNPLRGAPHTAACALGDTWEHPYSRATAVYPAGVDPDKYWPPVRRVDGAYGDRHLVVRLVDPA